MSRLDPITWLRLLLFSLFPKSSIIQLSYFRFFDTKSRFIRMNLSTFINKHRPFWTILRVFRRWYEMIFFAEKKRYFLHLKQTTRTFYLNGSCAHSQLFVRFAFIHSNHHVAPMITIGQNGS